MIYAIFMLGLVVGAFFGAIALALVVAADERPNRRAARVHLYPSTSARTYRVVELWPGEVLAVNGGQRTVRYDSAPNEAFGGSDRRA